MLDPNLDDIKRTTHPTDLEEERSMSDVVYTSEVEIVRQQGPKRLAHLPAEKDPVRFGVHGAIAQHYGVDPDVADPAATTIDYVVAATGG